MASVFLLTSIVRVDTDERACFLEVMQKSIGSSDFRLHILFYF